MSVPSETVGGRKPPHGKALFHCSLDSPSLQGQQKQKLQELFEGQSVIHTHQRGRIKRRIRLEFFIRLGIKGEQRLGFSFSDNEISQISLIKHMQGRLPPN